MEKDKEPDTENIHYLDEYPHLEQRVRLRRIGQLTLFASDMGNTVITLYESSEPPDGAA